MPSLALSSATSVLQDPVPKSTLLFLIGLPGDMVSLQCRAGPFVLHCLPEPLFPSECGVISSALSDPGKMHSKSSNLTFCFSGYWGVWHLPTMVWRWCRHDPQRLAWVLGTWSPVCQCWKLGL